MFFYQKTQDKERRFPMLVSYVQDMQFWFDLEIDDAIIHKSGPEWLAWVSHVVDLTGQLHELIVRTLAVKFRKLQFLKEDWAYPNRRTYDMYDWYLKS